MIDRVVHSMVRIGLLAAVAVLAVAERGIAQSAQPAAGAPMTLAQAEQVALQNHPQIQAAQYVAQAADQVVRETRAAYFPSATGSVTGAEAQSGSRIAAGALNNPIIYDRLATGVSVGQLVTDFGRTGALVQSASLTARAQSEGIDTQRAQVLLDVDRSYFGVLRAQAVERVAHATVDARQLVLDQVTALAQSNLRSGLDLSFAHVNLSSAELLLAQAQNETQRAFAALGAALGARTFAPVVLAEEPTPAAPPADVAPLVAEALAQRPDVLAARFSAQAASSLAEAEHDLYRPTVAAAAAAGVTPVHQTGITDRYSAVGVNVSVPVFNGNLFGARSAEAALRARAAEQRLKDIENQVSRDVQVAWLNARTAFQRLDLTTQLLDQASQALDLAQSRYNLGLSSIVELSQAQLNKTQAELEQASAKYDYQVETAALAFATGRRK